MGIRTDGNCRGSSLLHVVLTIPSGDPDGIAAEDAQLMRTGIRSTRGACVVFRLIHFRPLNFRCRLRPALESM